MKAAVFKGPGQPLAVEQVADPTPADGQLVVQVAYCGICGTDLHSTREGPAMVACNSVLGHEFVGEVVATGAHLQGHWDQGERVCALPFHSCGHCAACMAGRPFECLQISCIGLDAPGGYAEYVTTSECNTLRLPGDLAMADAALIEPLAVGLHAVRVAGLAAGQRVLITGAGPIGLAVALWARFLGARDVVVSEPAEQRRALATSMGATAVLGAGDGLAESYADLTGGAPDMIFECVGAPGLLQQCIDLAPRRGTLVPVGVCEQPDTILPFPALIKELVMRFAIAYTRSDYETVIAMLAQGRIDASPMVTGVVSLEDMPAAFEALRSPSDQCKVLTRCHA
jgi:(R,R)-butanediol dehydrogenase/meso-butanediol dehydrogenase/diacetyl reductase